MGSTICVRCGASLIPHSFCYVCHDVLFFKCSSCSMNTDERIHVYCRNLNTANNDMPLEHKQKLMKRQITDDDYYVNSQNHLNDEIKYSSINLSTSYWNNIFESIKLVNRYWTAILNIGINSSPIIFQKGYIPY
jgi:hypothetical protein